MRFLQKKMKLLLLKTIAVAAGATTYIALTSLFIVFKHTYDIDSDIYEAINCIVPISICLFVYVYTFNSLKRRSKTKLHQLLDN